LAYEPVRTADGHATRAIVEAEADVVRRIFALARDGYGVKRIAATLNGDAAPAPRKAGRVAGWAPSTVRGVLHNELYRGTLVWSRTRKRDVWGQRRPSRRDESEVVRVDIPELRIVDETVWQRAHERLDAGRALYFARAGSGAAPGGGRRVAARAGISSPGSAPARAARARCSFTPGGTGRRAGDA
jgi:Recombinase